MYVQRNTALVFVTEEVGYWDIISHIKKTPFNKLYLFDNWVIDISQSSVNYPSTEVSLSRWLNSKYDILIFFTCHWFLSRNCLRLGDSNCYQGSRLEVESSLRMWLPTPPLLQWSKFPFLLCWLSWMPFWTDDVFWHLRAKWRKWSRDIVF